MSTSFKDHFSSVATQYAAYRPGYPAELFDYLAGLCGARRLAWDCACGNGQATVPLAERFEEVLGSDASAKQVASAVPHPRARYRVAPAEDSGLEAGSADLVTVAQALHWLDLPRFYAEVERVLTTGGVLAVWTYASPHLDEPRLDGLLQRFNHDTVGASWPPERRLVEEGYRSLSFPFPELDAPQFQLQQHWNLPHLVGYVRSWSATQRFIAEHGIDPVNAFAETLAESWGDAELPRRIAWPLRLRVGRSSPWPTPY